MIEATVKLAFRGPQKIKRYTRKHLYKDRVAEAKAAKYAAKREQRQLSNRARRETSVSAPFMGCDPERTLALIGEEN